MPGRARKDVVEPSNIGVYHCYNRCVFAHPRHSGSELVFCFSGQSKFKSGKVAF